MEEEVETLKVVVLGDIGVGKSSLLITHTTRIFPGTISTVVDTFETQLGYMNRLFSMDIYDTAGSPGLADLRKLSYANADVFMLCYSIISEASFQSCFDFWKKEIENNFTGDPTIVLVGLKEDLRKSKRAEYKVSEEEATDMMMIVGARESLFVSALDQYNLDEVFRAVIRAATHAEKKPRRLLESCTIS